jgi:hypothetical protein
MYTSYMPILSSIVFDNTGSPYNVTRILTDEFVFDQAAYEDYSRVFMSATYILSYALQFAALPALIVHTTCWYGRDTWRQFKECFAVAKEAVKKERRDSVDSSALSRHTSNISNASRRSTAPTLDSLLTDNIQATTDEVHADVPNIWYIITGLSMTAVGIYVVEG